jgi:hypothetical protein
MVVGYNKVETLYGVIEILRIESYNLTIQSRNIDANR